MWLQEIAAYWILIFGGLLLKKIRFCHGDGVLEEDLVIVCCIKLPNTHSIAVVTLILH
jgi:hypothetical protein